MEKTQTEDQVNGRERGVIGNGEEDEEGDGEGGNIEEEVHVKNIRIMDRGQVNIVRVDTVKEDGKVRIFDENEKR